MSVLLFYTVSSTAQFDVEGHRGCRGLMPENTIPAFIKAVDLGVTTIELDVVITSDRKVLVSHDPWMSSTICLDTLGQVIPSRDEKKHNIYRMTVAEAQQYDCGSRPHGTFQKQEKMKVHKPLLGEMIDAVESYCKANGKAKVRYNIEIKSTKKGDNIYHPAPVEFTDLVLEIVIEKGIAERTIIQSFDPRILRVVYNKNLGVRIALLVANLRGLSSNLKSLGFKPDIYSPYYKLLKSSSVKKMHDQHILVVPWTVNSVADMKKLIGYGVDGLITDYPDRLIELISP